MFDFDLSSITKGLSNLWDNGTSAISNEASYLWNSGASLFTSSPMSNYNQLPNSNCDNIFNYVPPSDITPTSFFGGFMPSLNCDFSFMGNMFNNMFGNFLGTRNVNNTPATGDYADLINKVATEEGVDPKLLSKLVKQESGYNPNAVSPCGAIGLCQLMPKTAEGLGFSRDEMYDPEKNLKAGAKYLKAQLDKFGSVEKALAAYNAGPGAVEQYGGVPPYGETEHYVAKIMSDYNAA